MANYALPLGSPIFKAAKADGTPLSGGKLYAYGSDGDTPKTTWNSGVMSAETANINPVILDSRGEAWIFGTGLYLFVLKDSSGVTIWTSPPTLLLDVTDKARALLDDTSYSAMRTTLGLGTAAVEDAGEAAGEVVLLESDGKLPAVDGSQLTNLGGGSTDASTPRGYIDGLILSRSNATTFGIAKGLCRDADDNEGMALASNFTKTLAGWSVGTGAGSLASGLSLAINTYYHVFIIKNPTTKLVDVIITTSASGPVMPSGYSRKRRVGTILTNASSEIVSFTQNGDEFLWLSPVIDNEDADTIGTTASTITLTTPLGVQVRAILNINIAHGSQAPVVYLSSPDVTDELPVLSDGDPVGQVSAPATSKRYTVGNVVIRTSDTSTIRARSNVATTVVNICTMGWLDLRGQNE